MASSRISTSGSWSVESRTETKLVPRSVKVNRRVPSTSRPSGQFKPPRVQSSVNNRHISSHNIDSKINSESVQISNIKNNDKPSPESGLQKRKADESKSTLESPRKKPFIGPRLTPVAIEKETGPANVFAWDRAAVKNNQEESIPVVFKASQLKPYGPELPVGFKKKVTQETTVSKPQHLKIKINLKRPGKKILTVGDVVVQKKMSALDKYLDSEEHEGGVVEEKENNNIDADTEGEIIDSLTAVKVSDYVEGACVECEEVPGNVKCLDCDDYYCTMCFSLLHRKGTRKTHKTQQVEESSRMKVADLLHEKNPEGKPLAMPGAQEATQGNVELGMGSEFARYSPEWFMERAKYIPVRLSMKERKRLRLVSAALAVSDYTGHVDQVVKASKRTHKQIKEICALLSGIITSFDYQKGQAVVNDRNFSKYAAPLCRFLEHSRRYKIMNPEMMRTDYGKLIYLLQDTMLTEIQNLLGFNCVAPIKTVFQVFQDNECLAALSDPDMKYATMEILPENKSRHQIQREIKTKESAQEKIGRKYANNRISRDDIKWCLYSMGDNNSFLTSNRLPIDHMIMYLKKFFSPDHIEDGYSLAISGGVDGARLTHSHGRQYNYVLQSLTLWREITDDMFRLWCLAEEDILDSNNKYVLKDTGQGMQRVQASPRVLSAMRTILHRCQVSLGSWIGSSVIHLGDSNVPNALLFIEKYAQVARILRPIISAIREIDFIFKRKDKKDESTETLINSFGGPEKLKKDILYDFYRNAFDGSGADNFFDAGSCIDGRLTSAWNWCSTLPDKPFFPIFRLSGFVGFDGEFQD
eukprot:m.29540 g.29540  ORF g.29540 m.29540 type:complete len:811 (-) comp8113_c0_seq2:45-2477(-)